MLYPEHARMEEVAGASQAIGEFLEGSGYALAEADDEGNLYPMSKTIEQVLADYFGLDLAKIEAERRQMLERMREMNAG